MCPVLGKQAAVAFEGCCFVGSLHVRTVASWYPRTAHTQGPTAVCLLSSAAIMRLSLRHAQPGMQGLPAPGPARSIRAAARPKKASTLIPTDTSPAAITEPEQAAIIEPPAPKAARKRTIKAARTAEADVSSGTVGGGELVAGKGRLGSSRHVCPALHATAWLWCIINLVPHDCRAERRAATGGSTIATDGDAV